MRSAAQAPPMVERSRRSTRLPTGVAAGWAGLLALQQAGGNRAVTTLIQRNGNRAGTSTSTGIAPGVPATLSAAQQDAINLIDTSPILAHEKTRARGLIGTPDAIDQAAFGVCGLVAMLRAVVLSSPVRFAEMVIAALTDAELRKQWLPVFQSRATPAQQTAHAEVEFLTSQWLVRKSPPTKMKQKVLGAGGTVEKEKTSEEVIKKQREFSDEFEIKGWENTLGHFAVTTGGLNYLLNSVGSGKSSYKIKVNDFGTDYASAKSKAGATGSVLASVTNTDFYKKDGAEVTTAGMPRGKPKFVHWVILDNAFLVGDFYHLVVWTWANYFPAQVHKNVIKTHIYSLIAAEAG